MNARRAVVALLALALAFMLTSCESAQQQCEAAGGVYVQTGSYPQTTYIRSGDVLVPITTIIPVYECTEVDR